MSNTWNQEAGDPAETGVGLDTAEEPFEAERSKGWS